MEMAMSRRSSKNAGNFVRWSEPSRLNSGSQEVLPDADFCTLQRQHESGNPRSRDTMNGRINSVHDDGLTRARGTDAERNRESLRRMVSQTNSRPTHMLDAAMSRPPQMNPRPNTTHLSRGRTTPPLDSTSFLSDPFQGRDPIASNEKVLQLWPNKNGNQAPVTAFWSSSISNAIGPACGIVALKYISYPAQVLAKSSKMIPVMFMGALVYGVRYTLPEYLCTFLVAGGVSVFALFKSSKKVFSKTSSPNAPLGYALCLLNLGLDGFTNATQDSITKQYPKTTAWHIMMGMNLWGSIYTSLFMFGWRSGGGGWEAVAFLQRHPAAAWDILLFCVCGAVGQNFIFLTISRFGALTNTTVTTTRKFVSILVSVLWNGNPLSRQQWAGVVMVFSGLMYQIYLKWHKHSNALKQKDTKNNTSSSILQKTPKTTGILQSFSSFLSLFTTSIALLLQL